MILIPALLFAAQAVSASGLDVQLKDLRRSYFYVTGGSGPAAKECKKLVTAEIKKYGRLTHCDPEQDHVMCEVKDGQKIFAFEAQPACEAFLKKGLDTVPAED